MIRRALAVVSVVAAVVALVAACDGDGWKQTAPFAPSLRPAFGARVTDGQLHIWTGSQCRATTRLALTFDPYQDDRAELELSAPNNVGVDVEYLTLGEPVPGLKVTKALPGGFDWRNAESVHISVHGDEGGWGSSADIAEVVKGSAEHPEDTYWFQDVGWLNPAQVAEQDGKSFLATCTADPAKQ